VASRGKLAGKSIPVADAESLKKKKPAKETAAGPSSAHMASAGSKAQMKALTPALPVAQRIYPIMGELQKPMTPEDEAIVMDDDMFLATPNENEANIWAALSVLDNTDDEAGTMSIAKRKRTKNYRKWPTSLLQVPPQTLPSKAMRSVIIPEELSFVLNYRAYPYT
jgi:hypothetical protein